MVVYVLDRGTGSLMVCGTEIFEVLSCLEGELLSDRHEGLTLENSITVRAIEMTVEEYAAAEETEFGGW